WPGVDVFDPGDRSSVLPNGRTGADLLGRDWCRGRGDRSRRAPDRPGAPVVSSPQPCLGTARYRDAAGRRGALAHRGRLDGEAVEPGPRTRLPARAPGTERLSESAGHGLVQR